MAGIAGTDGQEGVRCGYVEVLRDIPLLLQLHPLFASRFSI
jgi:hypothetical protein